MCRRIGCSPERLAPEKGQAAESRRAEAKYIIRCESCGRESRYMRRGKAVDLLLRGRGRALRCTGLRREQLQALLSENNWFDGGADR